MFSVVEIFDVAIVPLPRSGIELHTTPAVICRRRDAFFIPHLQSFKMVFPVALRTYLPLNAKGIIDLKEDLEIGDAPRIRTLATIIL